MPANLEKIKTIIVDDQAVYRQGLRALLGEIEQVQLMRDASNGKEFLEIIKKKKPDVVLMDIIMPVMNGIEATKQAVNLYPDIKVIVISNSHEKRHLVQMIRSGVRGFLLKSADEDELKKAIIAVHTGENYYSNELLPLLAFVT
jgi:DNA-binding NarL/FixJ family response regulator